MTPERPAHSATESMAGEEEAGQGRITFCDDLHARGIMWSEAEELAANREYWRNLLPIVPRRDRMN